MPDGYHYQFPRLPLIHGHANLLACIAVETTKKRAGYVRPNPPLVAETSFMF